MKPISSSLRAATTAVALGLSGTLALASFGVAPSLAVSSDRGIVQSNHGGALDDVFVLTETGGPASEGRFDQRVAVACVSGFDSTDVVFFPAHRLCDGVVNRIVIPTFGRSSRGSTSRAPTLRIAASRTAGAQAAGSQPIDGASGIVQAGALRIETPWLRATPGGAKVAGGYVRVTNTGPTADRLLGASLPLATRGEVHAMSMENGIARMAPLEDGIEIKPGETIELKPGANHLMFMDLTGGLEAGETLAGTLLFEKAGRVAVTFRVEGIGAQAPASGGHMH